jgi:hypothetical protein
MVGNTRQLSIRWFVPAKLKRKPFNSNVADYLLIIATLKFGSLRHNSSELNIRSALVGEPGKVRKYGCNQISMMGVGRSQPRGV